MGNKNIIRLMSKEMDRKDFLKYSGGVLLAVIGVSGLLNTLLKLGNESTRDSHVTSGYGGSSYGK
jgi:hypothetical protein